MQNSLNLKSYEVPEDFSPQAKQFCKELVGDIEKTHGYYQEQMLFLKQQFKIALRRLRPGFISEATLGELFDEVEMTTESETEPEIVSDEKVSNKNKSKKKKKPAIPDHLPRTVIEHDLSEDKKVCEKDSTQLSSVGFDVKLELKYTPAKFHVIEHRFPKYSCSKCREGIFRKDSHPALIPQSYASAELLAHIAVSKFCDHLPLYRQEGMYGREGINLTRQVMADWMIKLGSALNPLIGIMREQILDSPVVSADETPVKILTKDGVRTSAQAYMWQISRWGPKPIIVFEFDPTRKKEVAEKLLGGYEGYVQIDGYGGYDILFNEKSPRIRVGCLAHVFRKFKDLLETLDKDLRKAHSANKILKMIDDLYDIEEECRGFSAVERKKFRLEQGAEVKFEKLHEFILAERLAVSKSSPYYSALRYADEELPHIRHYLAHGFIEIDNNFAENAIRPFALGRRNWLFICSEQGAQASANIYSLLITAKANAIEPRGYLTRVIEQLPLCQTIEDYEVLLPA